MKDVAQIKEWIVETEERIAFLKENYPNDRDLNDELRVLATRIIQVLETKVTHLKIILNIDE